MTFQEELDAALEQIIWRLSDLIDEEQHQYKPLLRAVLKTKENRKITPKVEKEIILEIEGMANYYPALYTAFYEEIKI